MQRKDVECGNKEYTVVSVDSSDVEGVEFAQIIVELPNLRMVPRTVRQRHSFYVWRPSTDASWAPMPVSELDRIRALCFEASVAPCATDDEQRRHIDEMVLMIEDSVVLSD